MLSNSVKFRSSRRSRDRPLFRHINSNRLKLKKKQDRLKFRQKNSSDRLKFEQNSKDSKRFKRSKKGRPKFKQSSKDSKRS